MPYAVAADLAAVRAFVRAYATDIGLPERRIDMLALAVSELTSNTLQYTRGGGVVSVFTESGQLVCDVVDSGAPQTFPDMPPPEAVSGRGLAIVNRVADEVSTAVGPDGTRVRLRMNLLGD